MINGLVNIAARCQKPHRTCNGAPHLSNGAASKQTGFDAKTIAPQCRRYLPITKQARVPAHHCIARPSIIFSKNAQRPFRPICSPMFHVKHWQNTRHDLVPRGTHDAWALFHVERNLWLPCWPPGPWRSTWNIAVEKLAKGWACAFSIPTIKPHQ